MKFKLFLPLIALFLAFAAMPVRAGAAAPPGFDYSAFSEIPVLHQGRVKPLESFARAYLLAFYGRSSLPGMSASAWLAELLFAPQRDYLRPIFDIPNPETLDAIGLPWRLPHVYDFVELSKALDAHADTVDAVMKLDDAHRTPAQRQLLDLYDRAAAYAVLSDSFTLLRPDFRITDTSFAQALRLPQNHDLALLDLMPHESEMIAALKPLEHKKPDALTPAEKQDVHLAARYFELMRHQESSLFRIVPPQWSIDNGAWFSPSVDILEGHGSPQSAAYLALWQKLMADYTHHDAAAWNADAKRTREEAYKLAGPSLSPFRMKLEVAYLNIAPFEIALGFYLFGFALLLTSFFSERAFIYKTAVAAMLGGVLFHFGGIVTRIVIMDRPPVATLYETTLFVSLIAVGLALAFERRRRDTTSLLSGSIIGSVLLFISMRYAADGDTMGMLVAVLNTNFWLATHVVAVTMGYGCSLLAGTLGHIYLIGRIVRPEQKEKRAALVNAITAVGLIAAFFATLGTILGGIWADQSWGRFWGWDPKENGAMLIVLWLLWLLHGRISGVLSPLNFATGMAATTVIVALSWFGVNLLGVGLHSYGFTSNIAVSLGLFCGAELLFFTIARGWLALKGGTAGA